MCHGERLCAEARFTTVGNKRLPEVTGMTIAAAMELYERGVLSEDQVGMPLPFGSGDALVALPEATGPQVRAIVENCRRLGVGFKTVRTIGAMLSANPMAPRIRDVRVEDLMRRAPAHLDTPAITECVAGKTVLVTGAGGTIGAELVRQHCAQVTECRHVRPGECRPAPGIGLAADDRQRRLEHIGIPDGEHDGAGWPALT